MACPILVCDDDAPADSTDVAAAMAHIMVAWCERDFRLGSVIIDWYIGNELVEVQCH